MPLKAPFSYAWVNGMPIRKLTQLGRQECYGMSKRHCAGSPAVLIARIALYWISMGPS